MTMPEPFWQGIDQFNQHRFYDCHDTLEALWMEASEPDRSFYQGLLQIAVALYHLENHNWRGAVILLGEGNNRLSPYLPTYADLDLETFLTQTQAILTTLQEAGADRVAELAEQISQRCTIAKIGKEDGA